MKKSKTFNENLSIQNLIKEISDNNYDNGIMEIYLEFERFYQSGTTFRKLLYKYKLLSTLLYLEKEFNSKRKAEKLLSLLIEIDLSAHIYDKNFLRDTFEISLGISNFNLNFGESSKKCPLRSIIDLLGYERSIKLLRTILDRNNRLNKEHEENRTPIVTKIIKLHDFSLNLPVNFTKHNISEENNYKEIFAEECFNFLNRLFSEYSDTSVIYTLINFINYKKVRNFNNIDECLNYINIVKDARRGMNFGGDSLEEKITNYSLLLSENFDSQFISFSKKPCDVNTIGEKTLCCFKPGGLAKSLLKPAINSPISGIFFGEYGKLIWFAFVWEIIEYNKETNEFEVNLILDNIEANQQLKRDNFEYIMEKLRYFTKYKKIYLGDSRNDISSECYDLMDHSKIQNLFGQPERLKRIDRPYTLIGYEQAFKSYSTYDDSRKLLLLIDNDNKTDNIYVSLMDNSWLHRCKYVERLLYGNNEDPDFLSINIEESPCFVIHSDNKIYGYFVTRLLKMEIKSKKIFFTKSDYKNYIKNLGDKFDENNFTDIIYFEDIFIVNNTKILSSMKFMINYIKEFVKDKNIKYYSASFNKYSEPFKKRLNELEFIKDERIDEDNPYISEKTEYFRKCKFDGNINIISNI